MHAHILVHSTGTSSTRTSELWVHMAVVSALCCRNLKFPRPGQAIPRSRSRQGNKAAAFNSPYGLWRHIPGPRPFSGPSEICLRRTATVSNFHKRHTNKGRPGLRGAVAPAINTTGALSDPQIGSTLGSSIPPRHPTWHWAHQARNVYNTQLRSSAGHPARRQASGNFRVRQ